MALWRRKPFPDQNTDSTSTGRTGASCTGSDEERQLSEHREGEETGHRAEESKVTSACRGAVPMSHTAPKNWVGDESDG